MRRAKANVEPCVTPFTITADVHHADVSDEVAADVTASMSDENVSLTMPSHRPARFDDRITVTDILPTQAP